jgi:hypothetical protein
MSMIWFVEMGRSDFAFLHKNVPMLRILPFHTTSHHSLPFNHLLVTTGYQSLTSSYHYLPRLPIVSFFFTFHFFYFTFPVIDLLISVLWLVHLSLSSSLSFAFPLYVGIWKYGTPYLLFIFGHSLTLTSDQPPCSNLRPPLTLFPFPIGNLLN